VLNDARNVERDSVLESDLCIVGAGAAGITIAREFVGTRTSVCLLESGGFELDEATQSISEGVATGTLLPEENSYLADSRVRGFGGTTRVWEGYCRPLDEIDFERRSWVRHSGWPFPKSLLEPFYQRANPLLEIGSFGHPMRDRLAASRRLLLPDSDKLVTRFFHYSPPTRFGERYRDELVQAPNVRICLYANAVDILTNESASRVEGLSIACLTGNRFRVRAKHYILATGGVENARLLLLSDRVQKEGLGNEHDLVGRFFMEHPILNAGRVVVADPADSLGLYDFHRDASLGHRVLGVLSLTARAQRENKLLNLRVHLRPRRADAVDPLFEAVGRTAARLHDVSRESTTALTSTPSIPSHFAAEVSCEQWPNPDSRVSLVETRDALGKRRVKLDWRLTRFDSVSVRRSLVILNQELGRALKGRVQLLQSDAAPWPGAWGPHHQMGTTRIHLDPTKGVVDPDCRVHSVSNLYVAGSSVFPTSGFANPTYTLVALALRLADHLKDRMRT